MIAKRIGNRVRERRKALKLTQSELAGEDFTKAYISQIEKGQVMPSLMALIVIARRLGRSLDYFVADAPSEEPDLRPNWSMYGVDPLAAADTLERLAKGLRSQ